MSSQVLAGRFLRLVAFGLDWLLTFMVTVMVIGSTRLLETAEALDSTLSIVLRVLAGGALAYLILHGWLLIARGQTFGMFLCRIAIVRSDSLERPAIWVLVLRSLVFAFSITVFLHWASALIYLADVVFIFSKKRRCLHDLLLQTDVVTFASTSTADSDQTPETQPAESP